MPSLTVRLALLAAVVLAGTALTLEVQRRTTPEPEAALLAYLPSIQACRGGQFEAGIAGLDSLLAARPQAVDGYAARGQCWWGRGSAHSAPADLERAHADYSRAIALADEGAPHEFSRAGLHSARAYLTSSLHPGDWEPVLADFGAAIAAAPNDPTPHWDRATVYALRGDSATAEPDLVQFIALTTRGTQPASAETRRAQAWLARIRAGVISAGPAQPTPAPRADRSGA